MAPYQKRDEPAPKPLSPVVLAVVIPCGVITIGLIIISILYIRDHRKHKTLLAELDERGLAIEQSREDAEKDSITRPRAVLRRNNIAQYNAKSGWGALTSRETINPSDPGSKPPHYAPTKPDGFVSKPKRLSWPFSARRASGRAIHMRKIRVPVLSTVIESPKPSPLVPVLSSTLGGEPSSQRNKLNRTSDQSLLQHHPAFRKSEEAELVERSFSFEASRKPEPLQIRSNSIAEIPPSTKPSLKESLLLSDLHKRSPSGNPPENELPPLPLEIARTTSETRRRNLLKRNSSHGSVLSFESTGSSILATQSSTNLRNHHNARVQKAWRDWRSPSFTSPRKIRDTFTLHGKDLSPGSVINNAAQSNTVAPLQQPEKPESELAPFVLPSSSSSQSIGRVKTAESVSMSKVSSPSSSPFTVHSLRTPKRRSKPLVTSSGSPEDRRLRSFILQTGYGNNGWPQRQLSQASTHTSSARSSYGNPFQWDPAPMSAGKPSNLKGSPSARRGHKRQNCVRISVNPTVLGASLASSPNLMQNIQEESLPTISGANVDAVFGLSGSQSLPRIPFSPSSPVDDKNGSNATRGSLTPSSPTLSMGHYDHGPIGSPIVSRDSAKKLPRDPSDRSLSIGSAYGIPNFPSPSHNLPSRPIQDNYSPPQAPPSFDLSGHSKNYEDSPTSLGASPSFDLPLDINSSPLRPFTADEYDPERPFFPFSSSTPPPGSGPKTVRSLSPSFSPIPEESSAQSKPTDGCSKVHTADDSSLFGSPKMTPAPMFGKEHEASSYNLPINATSIPEEPSETIDPSVLNNDAFRSLNSPFDNKSGSLLPAMPPSTMTRENTNNTLVPPSPTAKTIIDSLLEAAFPPSPTVSAKFFSNTTKSPISMYSLPSFSLFNGAPSSPRPSHAQLPSIPLNNTPFVPRAEERRRSGINFTSMPSLNPTPLLGPRGSPPGHLRSSIQQLRRMNSDAEAGGRGEKRYIRLGRQDSVDLTGEESWLDGLDDPSTAGHTSDEHDVGDVGEDDEGDLTWDEDKGRMLVGDILNDWEEDEEEEERRREALFAQHHLYYRHGPNDMDRPGALTPPFSPPLPLLASTPDAYAAFREFSFSLPPSTNSHPCITPTRKDRYTSNSGTPTPKKPSKIWDNNHNHPNANDSSPTPAADLWKTTPKTATARMTLPFPPNSPNKPKSRYLFLSSSPVVIDSPSSVMSTPTSRRRDFEVKRDKDVNNNDHHDNDDNEDEQQPIGLGLIFHPTSPSPSISSVDNKFYNNNSNHNPNNNNSTPRKGKENTNGKSGSESSSVEILTGEGENIEVRPERWRKRSVLGVGSPNVSFRDSRGGGIVVGSSTTIGGL